MMIGKIMEDLENRSGGKGKVMNYIFKEYFNLPVDIFDINIVLMERKNSPSNGRYKGRIYKYRLCSEND